MLMNQRKMISLAVVLVGIAMILGSYYIKDQVAKGNLQVEEGQRTVDSVNSLFSGSKYTKPIGKTLTGSGQKKIDAGRVEVDKYTRIANQLQIGGIIVIAMGAAFFFFWKKRK